LPSAAGAAAAAAAAGGEAFDARARTIRQACSSPTR
jgi:hypothetical protein